MDASTRANRLGTVEARWFGDGPLPPAVAAWFGDGELARREPERVDRYVRLPGVAHVGVKLREGRLEIKARRGPAGAMAVWAARPSALDAWLKWSTPVNALPADVVAPLDVAKARHLLDWPTPAGDVQVELAELRIDDAAFWTFGIEAPSAAAAEAVLASAWAVRAPAVDVAFAGAYPGWLERVAAG